MWSEWKETWRWEKRRASWSNGGVKVRERIFFPSAVAFQAVISICRGPRRTTSLGGVEAAKKFSPKENNLGSYILINSNGKRAQLLNWLKYQLSTLALRHFDREGDENEKQQQKQQKKTFELPFQLRTVRSDCCHAINWSFIVGDDESRAIIDDARKVSPWRLTFSISLISKVIQSN